MTTTRFAVFAAVALPLILALTPVSAVTLPSKDGGRGGLASSDNPCGPRYSLVRKDPLTSSSGYRPRRGGWLRLYRDRGTRKVCATLTKSRKVKASATTKRMSFRRDRAGAPDRRECGYCSRLYWRVPKRINKIRVTSILQVEDNRVWFGDILHYKM